MAEKSNRPAPRPETRPAQGGEYKSYNGPAPKAATSKPAASPAPPPTSGAKK